MAPEVVDRPSNGEHCTLDLGERSDLRIWVYMQTKPTKHLTRAAALPAPLDAPRKACPEIAKPQVLENAGGEDEAQILMDKLEAEP